ncbi:MAG: isoleucine--tRNA ligase [Pseudomonadota bacterium]
MSQNNTALADEKDYKSTLFLPKTDFPMRAGLPKKEPEILQKWQDMGLYKLLRQQSAPKGRFVLHDGPPYANGHLHIGHALNKILKDIIIRAKQMSGYDANYVPGWDCHGLPIEWKIEEEYRKKGKNKDEVDINQFRAECRAYAAEWLDIQCEEFKRLGVVGDWEAPYTTMKPRSEAIIAKELLKFAETGQLYRSSKPVLWSCVEKTALADAETEYEDKESHAIWVKFPVQDTDLKVVIWTTTPWTIPANLALAYGADISYGVYEVTMNTPEDNWVQKGEKFILADRRAEDVFRAARIEEGGFKRIGDAPDFSDMQCDHPFKKQGGVFAHERRLIAGDFVTDDAGTGIVHIAPGHGEDDYGLWLDHRDKFPKDYETDLPHSVQPDGGYYPSVPKFWTLTEKYQDKNNVYILKPNGKEGSANDAVIQALTVAGGLAARTKIKHSYPHSWRSKAPLIYRNTAQWFVSMEEKDLRAKALSELKKVNFYPEKGRNRITSMIETRPDWVVSRQRAWGVPLALFVCKKTGEIVNDTAINQRIYDIFDQESADSWWQRPAQDFFPDFDPDKHEQIKDILDVWFDSGSTHAFVLEERDDLTSPADLYLEGSDQHRGWFHSSLLQSCGTRGCAPYKAVLTHGFVLDDKGEKMSKSKGNVITPQEVMKDYGADILRLWVATSDYSGDLRIGKEILKGTADRYRRLRNTMRWMLGALYEYNEAEKVSYDDMPQLEKWALHSLGLVTEDVISAYEDYAYGKGFNRLFDFCTNDLSAFYFDVRKDMLYCDAPDNPARMAFRHVIKILLDQIIRLMAPICPFTADEAWGYLSEEETIHTENLLSKTSLPKNNAAFEAIEKLRDIRKVVTACLEEKRANKDIGASLEAAPIVYIDDKVLFDLAHEVDFQDICITSDIVLKNTAPPENAFMLDAKSAQTIGDDIAKVGVVFQHAEGQKCQRCWKILPDVDVICERCADVVTRFHVPV